MFDRYNSPKTSAITHLFFLSHNRSIVMMMSMYIQWNHIKTDYSQLNGKVKDGPNHQPVGHGWWFHSLGIRTSDFTGVELTSGTWWEEWEDNEIRNVDAMRIKSMIHLVMKGGTVPYMFWQSVRSFLVDISFWWDWANEVVYVVLSL